MKGLSQAIQLPNREETTVEPHSGPSQRAIRCKQRRPLFPEDRSIPKEKIVGYESVLKIARTVADLAGSETIDTAHVSEAIQYRSLDRLLKG